MTETVKVPPKVRVSHKERRAARLAAQAAAEPRIEVPPPFIPPRSKRDPALGRPGIMFCPNPECMKCFCDPLSESGRAERLFTCEDNHNGPGCGAQWMGWGRPRVGNEPIVRRREPGPVPLTAEERVQRAVGRVVVAVARLPAEQIEAIADQLEGRR